MEDFQRKINLKISVKKEKSEAEEIKELEPQLMELPQEEEIVLREKKFWHSIAKWIIISLIFLLPVFFSPWLPNLFIVHKQTLILILVLLAAIFWTIGSYQNGKISLPDYHPVFFIALATVFVVGLIAIIISPTLNFTLFGDGGGETDSLLNVFAGIIIFLLIISLFKEAKDFKLLATFFLVSVFFVLLFVSLNNFFNLYLNKPFLEIVDNSFTPAGAINEFSFLLGAGFLILMSTLFGSQNSVGKKTKILAAVGLILLFSAMTLIGFKENLIALALSLILFLALWLVKNRQPSLVKLNVVLFFAFVSLLLSFFNSVSANFLKLPAEVRLNFLTSLKIAYSVMKEGVKNLLLGSGPNTYLFNFLKHKPEILNLTPFWNIDFNQAYSWWLTILPSFGVLIVLALFLFFIFISVAVLKNFLKSETKSLTLGLVAVFFYLLAVSFFYHLNFVLLMFLFIVAGVAASITSFAAGRIKTIFIFDSSQKLFIFSLILTMLLVGSLFGLFFVGKRYAALAMTEYASISYYWTGDIDEAIRRISRAFNYYPNDNFARMIGQLWFGRLNQLLASQSQNIETARPQLQQAIDSAASALQIASDLNPKNYRNWAIAGSFYENTLNVLKDADALAIYYYQKTMEVNPKNPFFPLAIARVNFWQGNFESAEKNLNNALNLKPNYSDALTFLAQVYERQGRMAEAAEVREKIGLIGF